MAFTFIFGKLYIFLCSVGGETLDPSIRLVENSSRVWSLAAFAAGDPLIASTLDIRESAFYVGCKPRFGLCE